MATFAFTFLGRVAMCRLGCSLVLHLWRGLSVCLSVCVSVFFLLGMSVSCAKTAEPIEMPFGMWTRGGPRHQDTKDSPTTGMGTLGSRIKTCGRYSQPIRQGATQQRYGLWLPEYCIGWGPVISPPATSPPGHEPAGHEPATGGSQARQRWVKSPPNHELVLACTGKI